MLSIFIFRIVADAAGHDCASLNLNSAQLSRTIELETNKGPCKLS